MKTIVLVAALLLAGCTKQEANAAKTQAEADGAKIAGCIAVNVLSDTGATDFRNVVDQVKSACLKDVEAAAVDQFMLAIATLVGEHRAGLAATHVGVCR